MVVESVFNVLSKLFLILVAIAIMVIIIILTIRKGKENAKKANAERLQDLVQVERYIRVCPINSSTDLSARIMLMLLSKIPGVEKEHLQVLNANYRRKFTSLHDEWTIEDDPLTEYLKL